MWSSVNQPDRPQNPPVAQESLPPRGADADTRAPGLRPSPPAGSHDDPSGPRALPVLHAPAGGWAGGRMGRRSWRDAREPPVHLARPLPRRPSWPTRRRAPDRGRLADRVRCRTRHPPRAVDGAGSVVRAKESRNARTEPPRGGPRAPEREFRAIEAAALDRAAQRGGPSVHRNRRRHPRHSLKMTKNPEHICMAGSDHLPGHRIAHSCAVWRPVSRTVTTPFGQKRGCPQPRSRPSSRSA